MRGRDVDARRGIAADGSDTESSVAVAETPHPSSVAVRLYAVLRCTTSLVASPLSKFMPY